MGESCAFGTKFKEAKAAQNGTRRTIYWVKEKSTPMKSNTMPTVRGKNTISQYSVSGKYTGDWKNGLKHGYGVYEGCCGSKYEGEWVDDEKSGKGIYWVKCKSGKNLRKQYVGDWLNDKRHGQGTFFYDNGGAYTGEWKDNKREGQGKMIYGDAQGSTYTGGWINNERSGPGILELANGDRYDGYWVGDEKEGPGRHYYQATRKIYEGEWVNGSPKCGAFMSSPQEGISIDAKMLEASANNQQQESQAQLQCDNFELPHLQLAYPDVVLGQAIAQTRQQRVLNQVFSTATTSPDAKNIHHKETKKDESLHGNIVVFDNDMLEHLQHTFHDFALGSSTSQPTLPCEMLPSLLEQLNIFITDVQLSEFLLEFGASKTTRITFPECIDILSLLVETYSQIQSIEDSTEQGDNIEVED